MDDVGMRCANGYAKIYQRDDRLAVFVSELKGKAQSAQVQLDASRYSIRQKPGQCERIDLIGEKHSHPFKVDGKGQIQTVVPLKPWDVQVLILDRTRAA